MIDKQDPAILPYYAGIVGAAHCERVPGRCDLDRGIVTDDNAGTVTFHLTAPDPEFLYQLAFSWAYAVPASTPDHQISAAQLPATGPVHDEVAGAGAALDPGQEPAVSRVVAAGPARRLPGPDHRFASTLTAGQARRRCRARPGDVLLSPPPGGIGQLATHYTSQLHSGPLAATFALTLNTRTAPFDRLDARQAVNDASTGTW